MTDDLSRTVITKPFGNDERFKRVSKSRHFYLCLGNCIEPEQVISVRDKDRSKDRERDR